MRAPEVPQAFGALRKLTGLFFLICCWGWKPGPHVYQAGIIPWNCTRHQGVVVATWFSFHLHDIGYDSTSVVSQLEIHPELC